MSTQREPCGACKYMQKECEPECVFAEYFPPENMHRFECVDRVFGAEKLRNLISEHKDKSYRDGVVATLVYQAEARVKDPVNGCIGSIKKLEEKLQKLKAQIDTTKKELYQYISPEDLEKFLANPVFPPPPRRNQPMLKVESEGSSEGASKGGSNIGASL